MDHRLIEGLMEAVVPLICDHVDELVAAATGPLLLRIADLENRKAEKVEPDHELILRLVEETSAKNPGPAGRDGKDADPAAVAELVDKAVAALPPAKDGVQGPAGESVTVDQLAPLVAETVAREVEKLVVPAGAVGEKGEPGAPGQPGKSIVVEDVLPALEEIVAKRVAEIPVAKDGIDGKEGAQGRDGRDGLPGLQGEKGIDGRDGVDGRDGLGIEDFDVKTSDDGRTLEFSLTREGADPVVKVVSTGAVLDRGVWREQEYQKGDGVTWGGSFFVAQRSTLAGEKPGEASDAFRLAVKRGRDGGSAFDVARKNGFKGSEREWLDSLRPKPAAPVKVG